MNIEQLRKNKHELVEKIRDLFIEFEETNDVAITDVIYEIEKGFDLKNDKPVTYITDLDIKIEI